MWIYIFCADDDFEEDLKFQTGVRVMSNEECEKMLQEGAERRFWGEFPYGINRDFICTISEEGDPEREACMVRK